ncbi:hypothetical protein DLAC_08623 [Tieghemostelium lacteum]|uniref:Uncharacterized protein n=1 Tax=Tieghemostelium lacteum TaxID=361077 RepID=A0A151Z7X8_TIELA|nr:hypothetical protein DLAC_08623 [Tieghemostelium lacteum]|eukprot:KYQ90038.1 hypothetical protein DLAC_08623 [Tieghemostelium lacteum]
MSKFSYINIVPDSMVILEDKFGVIVADLFIKATGTDDCDTIVVKICERDMVLSILKIRLDRSARVLIVRLKVMVNIDTMIKIHKESEELILFENKYITRLWNRMILESRTERCFREIEDSKYSCFSILMRYKSRLDFYLRTDNEHYLKLISNVANYYKD